MGAVKAIRKQLMMKTRQHDVVSHDLQNDSGVHACGGTDMKRHEKALRISIHTTPPIYKPKLPYSGLLHLSRGLAFGPPTEHHLHLRDEEVGPCALNREQLTDLAHQVADVFNAQGYNTFNHNCQHYVAEVIRRALPDRINEGRALSLCFDLGFCELLWQVNLLSWRSSPNHSSDPCPL